MTKPAKGHMPFKGHRTQAEVREAQARYDQLPWCPEEYREHYRALRRKGWAAPVAKRLILEQIETDRRRAA